MAYYPKSDTIELITAVASLVAAVGTVAAVSVSLYYSSRDSRLRDKHERRKQAEQVTAWIDGWHGVTCEIQVRNSSEQPVYSLIVSLVAIQGAFRKTAVDTKRSGGRTFQRTLGLIRPGTTNAKIETAGHGMGLRFGIEIAFQDTAGRYWLREGQGALKEVSESPLHLYGIPEPASWERA